MPTNNDLSKLLLQRAGFEVVDLTGGENQLRLVGRVPPNASSHWVLIVHRLLETCERTQWKVDISRQYFLRKVGTSNKLFYAWRLIFQAPKIESHLTGIIQTIMNAPQPSRVELQEFPLSGAQRDHNNGRGAYAAETAPMAARVSSSLKMGGG